MGKSDAARGEIRQLARYQVRPESLARCLAAGILYPECLTPVEFTDYNHVVSNL